MSYLPKKYPAYNDTDKMPFGKYKDELLQDVPASYLKWLFDEMRSEYLTLNWNDKFLGSNIEVKIKLFNYINNSMNAIETELKGK